MVCYMFLDLNQITQQIRSRGVIMKYNSVNEISVGDVVSMKDDTGLHY